MRYHPLWRFLMIWWFKKIIEFSKKRFKNVLELKKKTFNLHWCFMGVCYKFDLGIFQECLIGVSWVFHGCLSVFHRYLMVVLRVFQMCFICTKVIAATRAEHKEGLFFMTSLIHSQININLLHNNNKTIQDTMKDNIKDRQHPGQHQAQYQGQQ